MTAEYHVASYVVRAHPDRAVTVAGNIEMRPGLEVHAVEDGKIIVTAEAEGTRELAEIADAMQEIEHVLAVAPVYHEYIGGDDAAQTEASGE